MRTNGVGTLAVAVLAGLACGQTEVRPIALVGTDGPLGPGLGESVVFEHLSIAAADDAKSPLFLNGLTTSPGSSTKSSHWVWDGEQLRRLWDPAEVGNLLNTYTTPIYPTGDRFAWRQGVPASGGGSASYVWHLDASSLGLLVGPETPLPGVGEGVTMRSLPTSGDDISIGAPSPEVSDAGAAFSALLEGPGVTPENETAVFLGTPGDLRLLVRSGQPLPGGGTVQRLRPVADVDDDGRVLVVAVPSTGEPLQQALLASGDGAAERVGDRDWTLRVSGARALWFAADGGVALSGAHLSEAGASALGVWHVGAGEPVLVLGAAPPVDTPDGPVQPPAPHMEKAVVWSAHEALVARMVGPQTEELVRVRGGSRVVVAASGDPAIEGLPHEIDAFEVWHTRDPRLALVGARLRSPGGAMLARVDGDALTPIAFSGQTVDIDPGPGLDLRVVAAPYSLTGRALTGLPDEIAVALTFTDGTSGVFLLPTGVCRADFGADGAVDISDLLTYLGAFRSAGRRADETGDGRVDVNDLLAFLGSFRQGCE